MKEIVDRLKHLITTIGRKDSRAKLIVMCDFNFLKADDVETYIFKLGLAPVLEEGSATHDGGGELDQIFTNFRVNEVETVRVEFSDHLA